MIVTVCAMPSVSQKLVLLQFLQLVAPAKVLPLSLQNVGVPNKFVEKILVRPKHLLIAQSVKLSNPRRALAAVLPNIVKQDPVQRLYNQLAVNVKSSIHARTIAVPFQAIVRGSHVQPSLLPLVINVIKVWMFR